MEGKFCYLFQFCALPSLSSPHISNVLHYPFHLKYILTCTYEGIFSYSSPSSRRSHSRRFNFLLIKTLFFSSFSLAWQDMSTYITEGKFRFIRQLLLLFLLLQQLASYMSCSLSSSYSTYFLKKHVCSISGGISYVAVAIALSQIESGFSEAGPSPHMCRLLTHSFPKKKEYSR